MKENINILAIIPARGGSKRIPNKNIKPLADKPLIAYTIETALNSSCFTSVVVSTDSKEIATVALNYGAEVPIMRSNHISGDDADVIDAILEIINYQETIGYTADAVMLLQPTSPFRTITSIKTAIDIYKKNNYNSVISVHEATTSPKECMEINSHGDLLPFFDSNLHLDTINTCYVLNGLIYLSSLETIKSTGTFYSKQTEALVIKSKLESIDIDVIEEWHMSEYFIRTSLSNYPKMSNTVAT